MRAGRVWIRKAAVARSFCSFFKLADLLIFDPEIVARNRVGGIGSFIELESLDFFVEFASHRLVVMLRDVELFPFANAVFQFVSLARELFRRFGGSWLVEVEMRSLLARLLVWYYWLADWVPRECLVLGYVRGQDFLRSQVYTPSYECNRNTSKAQMH